MLISEVMRDWEFDHFLETTDNLNIGGEISGKINDMGIRQTLSNEAVMMELACFCV
jgi:hypothetical protein